MFLQIRVPSILTLRLTDMCPSPGLLELCVFMRQELELQVAKLKVHGEDNKVLLLCAAASLVGRYSIACHFAGSQKSLEDRARREKNCWSQGQPCWSQGQPYKVGGFPEEQHTNNIPWRHLTFKMLHKNKDVHAMMLRPGWTAPAQTSAHRSYWIGNHVRCF